jgi:EAL domain-containing protein (putative c-di-GMP-specific phosphodiesterase class I)
MSAERLSGDYRGDLPFDFTMAFQPILDLVAGRVWAYEALVRGRNGESALTVLDQVDKQSRGRFDQASRVKAIELAARLFPRDKSVKLCINFMPNAVHDPAACLRTSMLAASRTGMPREDIVFEFSEQEEIRDLPHVHGIVDVYRRQGFMTAIDDFGSGYAGLKLLAAVQPDILKLDMGLLRNIESQPARHAILGGIIGITSTLGIELIAEGVETEEEVRLLSSGGVRLFQGYRFAKPELEALPLIDFGDDEPVRRRSA